MLLIQKTLPSDSRPKFFIVAYNLYWQEAANLCIVCCYINRSNGHTILFNSDKYLFVLVFLRQFTNCVHHSHK